MQIQWFKGFMCGTQTSHVGSLTVIFPCVVDNYSVLRELDVAGSIVSAVIVWRAAYLLRRKRYLRLVPRIKSLRARLAPR